MPNWSVTVSSSGMGGFWMFLPFHELSKLFRPHCNPVNLLLCTPVFSVSLDPQLVMPQGRPTLNQSFSIMLCVASSKRSTRCFEFCFVTLQFSLILGQPLIFRVPPFFFSSIFFLYNKSHWITFWHTFLAFFRRLEFSPIYIQWCAGWVEGTLELRDFLGGGGGVCSSLGFGFRCKPERFIIRTVSVCHSKKLTCLLRLNLVMATFIPGTGIQCIRNVWSPGELAALTRCFHSDTLKWSAVRDGMDWNSDSAYLDNKHEISLMLISKAHSLPSVNEFIQPRRGPRHVSVVRMQGDGKKRGNLNSSQGKQFDH